MADPSNPSRTWTDRARTIMGSQTYVSFQLDDRGHAVHLTRSVDGGIAIIEVAAGVMPPGARYTNVNDHVFAAGAASGEVVDKDSMVKTLETFLDYRGWRPLIVQVTPQGWHENLSTKLVLGIDDTGGQNKFVNESGLAMASLGFTVVNATRGGLRHPVSGESRYGMHYSYTGMDLLFLEDGEPAMFIPKEEMFAAPSGWHSDGASPPTDSVFQLLARALQHHLVREPRVDGCLLIGHYGDGGAVACLARDLLQRGVKVWFNPHSLCAEKAARLAAAGVRPSQLASLNSAARLEYERYVLDKADGVLCTSRTMADSLRREYGGRTADHILLPGVDAAQFHIRTGEPSDPCYAPLWAEMSALSGRTPLALQNATIIMEISRTVGTKGKDTVLRAFSELLTAEHKEADSLFLVMNISDPSREQIGPEERDVAAELHALAAELGVLPWLISKNHFVQDEVQAMHQLLFAFITGAVSEPWGMTVQQAAACQQFVVATTAVTSAVEALAPGGLRRLDAVPEHRVMVGDGALFFEPGDYRAAAASLRWALEHRPEAVAMAKRAHGLVAWEYDWVNSAKSWLRQMGYKFDAGRHVVCG